MAFKVFVKTDGKNLRVIDTTGEVKQKFYPAARCSIILHESQDMISIDNDLDQEAMLEPIIFSDLQDEAGAALGASFDLTVDALDLLIG